MGVVTVKSEQITARDAVPSTILDSVKTKASPTEALGFAAVANGDSTGSKYILCSIPSNARVSEVILANTAITTGAGDVGLYKSTKDGGAVVDADFFGSAVAMTSAQSGLDVTHESAQFPITAKGKRLWEALGLSADPMTEYDLVVTLTADTGGAGTVGALVRYAQ